MDSETYEQTPSSKAMMGNATDFLLENETAFVLVTDGKPIGVEMPNFVELSVTATEPGVKGDTATNATKPATLETGAVVSVPLFVSIHVFSVKFLLHI